MTRSKFTKMIVELMSKIINDGVEVILDYGMRSKIEQYFLYARGLSRCDGFVKLSKHQAGLAIDIYFVVNDKIDWGYETPQAQEWANKYHDIWVGMGGDAVIQWDMGHYQATKEISQ